MERAFQTSYRVAAMAALILASAGLSQAAETATAEKATVPMALQAFDLQDVRLGAGPCQVAQEANRTYLHFLDADRLLHTFRLNAGLPAPGAPLGGWEAPACEVRGHFIGHYLSACALMYASAGDESLKAKAEAMVAELAKCQEALGGGYLSAYPAEFLDRLERLERVTWAPLYVTHKIMAGLLDMYQYAGNRQALEILTRLAAYYGARVDTLSEYQMERLLTVEFGGMSEVLHNLYGITGDPAHLKLAQRYDQAAFLGPLALERDNLTRLHGNTQIPKICGAARHYELTGDERYRTLTRFFWDRVVNTRTYATGGTTLAEVWGEPNALAATLGVNNQECCKTHNLLKVTRSLIRWTADPAYADYYERAFFNGILGTQRADTGQMLYYVPLASGLAKQWGTPYDSFWCCYGTGVETFAKLGDSLFFHDADSITVNLFVAATVAWRERGLRLEQVTRFPEEEGTTLVLHLEQPATFALRVRIPYWVAPGATVWVNGEAQAVEVKPSSYVRLQRTWAEGDRVEVRLPMALHAAPMPDDPELVAVMYGPLVLAGLDPAPGTFILADPADPAQWVEKAAEGPLRFQTTATGPTSPLRLLPWYQIVDEKYGVYWTVTKAGSAKHQAILAEAEARRQREARTLDRVLIGNEESERQHNLQGEKHGAGPYGDRHWRHAPDGGWFSWELQVLPEAPMILCCTYWGSDVPPRAFDILVDGEKLVTQQLNSDKPGSYIDIEYAIPAALSRGKAKVAVRFQGHPGNTAGGVFGCAVLRAAVP